MASLIPPDTSLLQPTFTVPPPPPGLDPREPAPPPVTSPGGHIQTSRNRSTGTPRTPRTPTRSPARSAASSRAASPVPGLGAPKRSERGSVGPGPLTHAVHPSHLSGGAAIHSGPSSRGASPGLSSTSSSRRNSGGSGLHPGMAIKTNSIDAALASGAKGNAMSSAQNPHLPTSPLSDQDSSPPFSPAEGIAAGLTSTSNHPTSRSRPLSGTISPRARTSSQMPSRSIHSSADGAHHAGTVPAGTFLRPVSPALSATASVSDSMIFERDIESPLPPPIPSSVLDRRPSRRGSRASAINGASGQDPASSNGHSLAHSQTHSHSNLHHHYTHGDFLESKIPTVLDDAIEALTALSESEKHLQASGGSGVRTRLIDIEVESPVPVPVNWASVGASAPGSRVSSGLPRHHVSSNASRPVSPLRSGITSSKASNPTSPLLSAEQNRPQLSSRTSSVGPMLPGAFPSGDEQRSDSWRRKIQDWIGPRGLDDEAPVVSHTKKDAHELESKVKKLSVEEKEVSQTAPSTTAPKHYLPSSVHPSSTERHRISFVSYNDILSSLPLRVDPLSDLTSGATGEPDHLPGTVSPAHGLMSGKVLTPGHDGGVSRNVSQSRRAGASPSPGDVANAGRGSSPSATAIPTSIQDRLGISAHANTALPEERSKGEWEKEGLGKGLQERLEELIADTERS